MHCPLWKWNTHGQWELKVRKEGPCVMCYVHCALSGLHLDVKILYTRGAISIANSMLFSTAFSIKFGTVVSIAHVEAVSLMAHKHPKRQRGLNVGALILKWFSSSAQMCSLVAGLSVRHQGQDTLPTQYWQKSAFKNLKPPFRREKNTVCSPLLAKILNWKIKGGVYVEVFS